MITVFTVQKRGPQYWVVRNSDNIGTVEDGPHADKATANARAQTLATNLAATRNATNDLEMHVVEMP